MKGVGLAEGVEDGIKVGFWVGASLTMLRSMLLQCVGKTSMFLLVLLAAAAAAA